MQTLVIGPVKRIPLNNKSAFTLIELLIVMVIIGITVTFALLAMGQFNGGRKLHNLAEGFQGTVPLAQETAVLSQQLYGLRIEPHGYHYLHWYRSKWQPLEKAFWHKTFDDSITFELTEPPSETDAPQILISPTGDVTPFVLMIQYKDKSIRLQGLQDGTFAP